ncbi:hypothetical protein Q8F57_018415 [Paraburkholderia terrae]|uniref:hypothetical protein n=1 Tax=Paraburkholderia terrae TaxID=311230 RepID=UPI00296B2CCD|nr:hypothetical protein [Paraburkholderia terrae]MDW3655181.1 hypothetical protein [Paraburkholderia terrae]
MATLNETWQYLAQRFIPASATASQRRDMEIAFYSGASALSEILLALPDLENEDARVAVLDAINDEVDAFKLRMLVDILGNLFDTEPTPREPHSRFKGGRDGNA